MSELGVVLVCLLFTAGCGYVPGALVLRACPLLTVADVQALDPAVQWPTELEVHSTDDLEDSTCRYDSPETPGVELGVSVPLSRDAEERLDAILARGPEGATVFAPLEGVGDAAQTWVLPGFGQGISAKARGDLLSLFVHSENATVPLADMAAVMRRAISRLPPRDGSRAASDWSGSNLGPAEGLSAAWRMSQPPRRLQTTECRSTRL